MIVGIDEVGRGAWAGPVVVGAVILGPGILTGLTDSKKLSAKKREHLDSEIRRGAIAVGLGWVSPEHIDKHGMSFALKSAARQALAQIRADFTEIIIDGTIRLIEDPRARTMAKADLLIPSVSAASIIAKVARDAYMRKAERNSPGYGFNSHVGYGTAAHLAALTRLGASHHHRMSFEPLRPYRIIENEIRDDVRVRHPVSALIGQNGEDAAVAYLDRLGHTIVVRNWKTKWCEIDIVSRRRDTLYFTEVKYRRDDVRGGGMSAITPKKLQQMTFAARLYLHTYGKDKVSAQLAAADVCGDPPQVRDFLEIS